jgi:hypothetical protein
MESEQFDGRSAEMRKATPWLSSEDIRDIGHDVEVVIEAVYKHKNAVFDDGRKEDVFALKFQGKQKQLVLNATNRKRLIEIFGTTNVKQWAGKSILLYVEYGIRKPGGGKGDTTCGIRVRI